jgi:glutamate-1-semialdehyde 2,1-aminomutase
MTIGAIDQDKLRALKLREQAVFEGRTRRSREMLGRARTLMPDGVPMAWMAGLYDHSALFVSGGQGSRFTDVDGNSYIDFNLADLSNTIGYGENSVSHALARQAAIGIQHLLPTEDAIFVTSELRERTGYPFWQFTLSASGANTEVIRIARAFTGRRKVLVFEGKYHGHLDTTMVENGCPEAMGILPSATDDTVVVSFNDIDAVKRALETRDVALVLTEPALTNCTLVLADSGFLSAVETLCKAAGTLLCIDETHSWQFAYGGLTRAEGLEGDFLTLGKGLGTGVPLACYGMTGEIAAFLESNRDYSKPDARGLAIGGTTYGNALGMAAVRAGLEEIATLEAYERVSRLGGMMADGLEQLILNHGLPWRAFRKGPRTGLCLSEQLPRTAADAKPSMDTDFSSTKRLYMANRGLWDAIATAGPQVSFAHTEQEVGAYISVAADFLNEIVSPQRQ